MRSFEYVRDAQVVVYRADTSAPNGDSKLFLLEGPDERPMLLNDPLPERGDVFDFRVVGDRAVYFADQETSGVQELYSVPIARPAVESSSSTAAGRAAAR